MKPKQVIEKYIYMEFRRYPPLPYETKWTVFRSNKCGYKGGFRTVLVLYRGEKPTSLDEVEKRRLLMYRIPSIIHTNSPKTDEAVRQATIGAMYCDEIIHMDWYTKGDW